MITGVIMLGEHVVCMEVLFCAVDCARETATLQCSWAGDLLQCETGMDLRFT